MPSYTAGEPKKAAVYYVEPGTYKVKIVQAVEKQSQQGNPMIKLDCQVLLPSGTEGPTVWEHLVFTPKASWKIDQFLTSIGRAPVPGEDVDIDPVDLIDEIGVAVIGDEPGSTNPDHKFNKVERWLFGAERKSYEEESKKTSNHVVAKGNGYQPQPKEDGDDIPF